jgi:nucleoside phosphorylase
MLIVFGALKTELDNIIRGIQCRKVPTAGLLTAYVGMVEDEDVLIVITGMGRENATEAVNNLFSLPQVKSAKGIRVLVIGFCGAADKKLRAGDLVICKKVMDLTGKRSSHRILPCCRPAKKPEDSLRAVVCGCTDHIVSTPEEKRTINRKYGVDVIDMESYWIIEGLIKKGLLSSSISCIRAVSDDAEGRLPNYFTGSSLRDTILKLIRSAFISIFSRDEFRANIDALRSIRKAKEMLDKRILFLV